MSEAIKTADTTGKKRRKWVLPVILAVLLMPVVVAAVMLCGRLATVASIRHVDQDLYQMTVKQDYFLDELLEANISSAEDMVAFINRKMYFGLADAAVQNPDFGCCSFLAKTPDGHYVAGRNYDFADAGELVFYTRSLSFLPFGFPLNS